MRRLVSIACFAVLAATAPAQTLRFYTDRYRVFEGDAVRFIYHETTNAVAKTNIASWAWDFDGNGSFDSQGTNVTEMDQTWYATLNPNQVTNGVQKIAPILKVSTIIPPQTLYRTNLTEDFRLGNPQDPLFLEVVEFATGNSKIQINFSANPRLVETNQPVRFYADVTANSDVLVNGISWNFGDGGTNSGSNPQHTYAVTNDFDVAMTVSYTITSLSPPLTTNISRTNLSFITVVNTPGELAKGRAYRRGFPQEYDWDDIVKAYSAAAANGDEYTYFHHFEDALDEARQALGPSPTVPDAQAAQIHVIVNEVLQGQTLIGNKRLIEALRIKYPRLPDPDNPPPRLPIPPGVRDQTAAIDVALLDYQAALLHVFNVVQAFGSEILRAGAPPGDEPFPDFPRYLTFVDPTLGQQPIPIKNEYWQLTSCLDKLALGTMEKAKKLFRLSIQEPEARDEAKEECKRAGLQGYLGMMVLAAGQSPEEFASNEGNSLLAHVKNARDLFEGINAGLNPLNNDGSFIPNESFSAIYQDAQEAVADAREAEIAARNEDRTYDQYQAELAKELLNQRLSFITPLRNLTGLDPALYNNLQTVDDQTDFRDTVNTRVKALIAGYPNTDPAGLGEYGAQVIAVLDGGLAIQQAINRLKNLYKGIEISKWANRQVDVITANATTSLQALDIARGYANMFSIQLGLPTTVTVNPGSYVNGILNAVERDIQRIQQAQISDVQLEAEIRKSLLEVANLSLDIRRAKNNVDQQNLRLDQMLSQMDRLIEDLAATRQTAANLYFSDPSFRVVVSRAQRRADAEMDFAIDRLYRLAKTLEYEWTEPYRNPVTIPVNCQEPPSLENPLFDKYTQLDDLFIAGSADEGKDYLDALKAWDSKLRRINVISVRGPNHAGPLTAEPISVREQVLGLATTGPNAIPLADSLTAFRNWLEQNRQTNIWNLANPLLQFDFSTGIADNSYFPATGSRWNMRITSISIDLLADQGFSTKQVAEIDLIESGMVTLRRFWAEPPLADDLFNLTFNVGRADRSAFGIVVPAKINGATGGRPASEFIANGLANRPIAATRWIFTIDTGNPSNNTVDFSKLKDIIIRFTYTYGNPEEFPNF